ncbi:LPXTG cell wall anchor domain-containing protein [Lactobacillus sp. PV034]|uniref:LPXTG cell wall anchor domain-containing protein n=1 Tax=Lactobacillus sp. PV034 TaxID=2594495 RepID=UPI00223FA612|nr:LPXTG cell wall anchor domain-containing protein [Lactobacillus sp. PV034]QNQ81000.1 LPXTG cell wall anchor domain-containing protein [Lactobacillus sp. PV034]
MIKKETATGTPETVANNKVASVVIYQTEDGKVIKTDIKEQNPGEKVEFNVPEDYVPVDKLPEVTVNRDMSPIKVIVVKKETATGTPETVANNKVASVVIYKTKDGKVIKTDIKEQKPGEKVEFNVPEGYVPVDKLPEVTVSSDMSPITVIVAKKQTDTVPPTDTPAAKVASVVIYETKDGKVVKTDVREQEPGEKVEFNVPEGYTPVDKLPEVTVTSDMKPIVVYVTKATPEPSDPVQPSTVDPNPQPTPQPNPTPNEPTTPVSDLPDPVVSNSETPKTETAGIHATHKHDASSFIEDTPAKSSNLVAMDSSSNSNNEKDEETLPQTGSKSVAGVLLGSIFLAASLALGFVDKKKRN